MNELDRLYKREVNYYRKLLKLTRRLEDIAGQGSLDDLGAVFSARQEILAKIAACEKSISTLRVKGIALLTSEWESVGYITGGIRKMLEEIIERDQRIGAKLMQDRDDIKDELKKIREGHKLVKGYAPKRVRIPRYIDKKW
ncbi:MAG: hypothetical protein SV775_16280 [Thermodesulfobacteriota bacterium]|nr:hypothetical protein [Thermodesulfobacteriota bacterium]